MLVHPHFSLQDRDPGKAQMKEAEFMGALWRGEIFKASQDEGVVFSIVKQIRGPWNMGRILEFGLVEYARERLGERFLEADSASIYASSSWDTRGILRSMGAEELKGLLAPGAKGVALGEFTSSCVFLAASLFENALHIPFTVDRLLSVDMQHSGDQMSLRGTDWKTTETGFVALEKNAYGGIFLSNDRFVPVSEFKRIEALAESRRS
ncbi:MAG: hypothetical protein WC759_03945 [Candidatus Micrarchaeia archaeon]